MEGRNSCSRVLSYGKHTRTIVQMNIKQLHSSVLLSYLALCINSSIRHTISGSYNIHSHKLTLHDTAPWSIVHTSPPLAKRGDVFSKGGKERKKEREKREKKWKERGYNEHRTPGGQLLILSSPSATFAILHDLVRSFPPTGAQLPYHVTTKPTNRSCF